MKSPKAILSAIALASATLVSSGAYAADISNPSQELEIIDNAAFFGAIFGSGNAGNTFVDKYTFTTTAGGSLMADVLSMSATAASGLNITGLGLYDMNGEVVGGTLQSTGATDSWTLSSANLAAGSYYVQISGSVVSNSAGKYYANVAMAPVPEPETYAMMLAGLGMLGFVARRRKQKAELAA